MLREYRLLAHDITRVAPIPSFLEVKTRLPRLPVLNKSFAQVAADAYLQQRAIIGHDLIKPRCRRHGGFDLGKSNSKTPFNHVDIPNGPHCLNQNTAGRWSAMIGTQKSHPHLRPQDLPLVMVGNAFLVGLVPTPHQQGHVASEGIDSLN